MASTWIKLYISNKLRAPVGELSPGLYWHQAGYRIATLTWLSLAYFLGEVLVVMSLVSVELGAARSR